MPTNLGTDIITGQVMVPESGLSIQLGSASIYEVYLDHDGLSAMYVGASGATIDTAYQVQAGVPIKIEVDNLNHIYPVCNVSGSKIKFMATLQ